ncbi:MAG: acyl-CoA dehydrogenase C-terminal domain-containing protein, partial [Siculibacillus sp.]|nr:acyl-CoA dehydrogenase C-terminal domain-containing protein [Siculibacillus sp.]
AIQSNALVGRSVLREAGLGVRELFAEIDATVAKAGDVAELAGIAGALGEALAVARAALDWLGEAAKEDPRLPFAASVPFLHVMGLLTGGWMLTRGAIAAADGAGPDAEFRKARIAIAGIFAAQYLPQAAARWAAIRDSSRAVLAFHDERL